MMMQKSLLFWFVYALLLSIQSSNCAKLPSQIQCTSIEEPYKYFSSLTPYDLVRGDFKDENACEAVQIWMLIRHGTRYFTSKNVHTLKKAINLQKQILHNHKSGKGELCDKTVADLAKWTWNREAEQNAGELTEQGVVDIRGLAKIFKARYPKLFGKYSPERYRFRHTQSNRTRDSCWVFIKELFGKNERVDVEVPEGYDGLLQPYKGCKSNDNIDKNNTEMRRFEKSAPFVRLTKVVSKRLGFDENEILETKSIRAMYDNCRYETFWVPSSYSAWCRIFAKEELMLLEYWNDLKFFYMSGPGNKYSARLGCPPLKHLRDSFSKATTSKGEPRESLKAVAMFSHDSMIDMTLTALGYYEKGLKLPGVGYEALLTDRGYRSSLTVPPAANIVAVLHRCSNGNYTVQLTLNERPMSVEGCPRGLCTWKNFSNLLSFAKECNLDFCKKNDGFE